MVSPHPALAPPSCQTDTLTFGRPIQDGRTVVWPAQIVPQVREPWLRDCQERRHLDPVQEQAGASPWLPGVAIVPELTSGPIAMVIPSGFEAGHDQRPRLDRPGPGYQGLGLPVGPLPQGQYFSV